MKRLLELAIGLMIGVLMSTTPADGNLSKKLRQLDQSLRYQHPTGYPSVDLSGWADYEFYTFDPPPPGLINTNRRRLNNPRLTLESQVQFTRQLYGYGLLRWDRGYDPSSGDGDLRLDEYFLLFRPDEFEHSAWTVGQFGSAFGNWIPRHQSWDNPFVSPPLPYNRIINISDNTAPASRAQLFARRDVPDPISAWPTVIWGANYSRGIRYHWQLDPWTATVEWKSDPLSARPSVWDDNDYDHPSWTGRLTLAPTPAWTYGLSASHGPYHTDQAASSLPGGTGIDDYNQTTVGVDLEWAHHRWQVWSEAIYSEFDIPNVESAWVISSYIETRYRWYPRWFIALRLNDQFFEEINNGSGDQVPWDRNNWRIDGSVTYRHSRQIQLKIQGSKNHENGPDDQGEELIASELTLRF